MGLRKPFDQIGIERLHEAHVGHCRVELLCRGKRRMQHAAEGENRDAMATAFAFAAQLSFADRQRTHFMLHADAGPASPRIAHRTGCIERKCRVEHLPALVLVSRSHHRRVGETTKVAQVEATGVRRPVSSDKTRAVDREHHGQILQHHVVDQLVVSTLQESGIDRDHRFDSLARQSRGEGHGVLLGDADVEISFRVFLGKANHARSFAHRRGDPDQPLIALGHVAQPIAKDLRIGRFASGFGDNADSGIELCHPVIENRVVLGARIAVAFTRHDVQKLGSRKLLHVGERSQQRVKIMPVYGADVVESEFLEKRPGEHHAFHVLFPSLGQFLDRRHLGEHFLTAATHAVVDAAR